MNNYYEDKMKFHHKQFSEAKLTGKEKAANKHWQEYLNYKEMFENMTR